MGKFTPGWGKPGCSRKWHYFPKDDGRSLCMRIGFYSGPTEQGKGESPDNCAECKRRLRSRQGNEG